MNEIADHAWIVFDGSDHPNSIHTSIARRIAEKAPVVIVKRPVSVLHDRTVPPFDKRCKRSIDLEDMWYYRPMHYPERLPGFGPVLRLVNEYCLQREVNRLLPEEKKKIVCYDSPRWHHLAGKIGEFLSVYFATDDFTVTLTGEPIEGELEAERELLSKIDMVICVSETLARRLVERRAFLDRPSIHVLPNCFNERIFDASRNWPEPDALRGISSPRVLVAGYISERIDWDGLGIASRLRPHWNWVFRGPADKRMQEKIVSTLGCRGFYFPPISAKDMPAWIKYCDACAVPYRLNSFTLASCPIKAYEYLAMGAPVLSTRVPSLQPYDKVIEWINEADGESYARGLDTIANEAKEKNLRFLRQQAVVGDSLSLRVDQFRQIVYKMINFPSGSLAPSSTVYSFPDGLHI
ncbi:MAG: glycosyltransferase [Candidatus Helarchaeota archaeon]|nr:glycosyltransferase [Candidatus Helarchaeota archaeon]